jgi:hypothetical protein
MRVADCLCGNCVVNLAGAGQKYKSGENSARSNTHAGENDLKGFCATFPPAITAERRQTCQGGLATNANSIHFMRVTEGLLCERAIPPRPVIEQLAQASSPYRSRVLSRSKRRASPGVVCSLCIVVFEIYVLLFLRSGWTGALLVG